MGVKHDDNGGGENIIATKCVVKMRGCGAVGMATSVWRQSNIECLAPLNAHACRINNMRKTRISRRLARHNAARNRTLTAASSTYQYRCAV